MFGPAVFGMGRWVAPGYALALALVITAPLVAPGYLLLRDAVSTPDSVLYCCCWTTGTLLLMMK